jgi:hypothetical protein
VIPFADGGATDAGNLQLRCRAHNAFEAERWSGPGEEDLLHEAGGGPSNRPTCAEHWRSVGTGGHFRAIRTDRTVALRSGVRS